MNKFDLQQSQLTNIIQKLIMDVSTKLFEKFTCVNAISAMGIKLIAMWNRGTASTNSMSFPLPALAFDKSSPFTEQ